MVYMGSGEPHRRNKRVVDYTITASAVNDDTQRYASVHLEPTATGWRALIGKSVEVPFKKVRFRYVVRTRIFDSDGNLAAEHFGTGRPATESEIEAFLKGIESRAKRANRSLYEIWKQTLDDEEN